MPSFLQGVDPQRAIRGAGLLIPRLRSLRPLAKRARPEPVDELLSKREEINVELQRIIDQQTEPGGQGLRGRGQKRGPASGDARAIASSRAERERRAKVIMPKANSKPRKSVGGCRDLSNPTALQLIYLQTLVEVGAEKNSTIIFRFQLISGPSYKPEKALTSPSMEQSLPWQGFPRMIGLVPVGEL